MAAGAGFVWLVLYVYFESAAGLGFGILGAFVAIGWLLASFGLACFWVAVAVVMVLAWKAGDKVRARRTAGFLVPLAVVGGLLVTPGFSDLPLRTGFDLSEGQLTAVADEYEHTGEGDVSGWAGLYRVESVSNSHGCTLIVTGNRWFSESGFARCSTPPGDDPSASVRFEHLKDDWWRYTYVID